jgi:hypothetical protein
MKQGKPVVVGWKDALEVLPIEPEGYSTAQQIAEKIHLNSNNVHKQLEKLGVPFVWGRMKSGQKTKFYKD